MKFININNFNTSNLKITEYMFQACTKLENIDLYKKKFQTQLNNYSNATLITQDTIQPTEKQLIAITFLSILISVFLFLLLFLLENYGYNFVLKYLELI